MVETTKTGRSYNRYKKIESKSQQWMDIIDNTIEDLEDEIDLDSAL